MRRPRSCFARSNTPPSSAPTSVTWPGFSSGTATRSSSTSPGWRSTDHQRSTMLPTIRSRASIPITPSPFAPAPLQLSHQHALLEFTWEGNAAKRLLVNTAIRPLVRRGPAATTEITLRAAYQPPTAHRRSPETVLRTPRREGGDAGAARRLRAASRGLRGKSPAPLRT